MKTLHKRITIFFCSFGVSTIRSVVVVPNERRSVAPTIARLGLPSAVFHPFGLRLLLSTLKLLPGRRCNHG